MIPSKDRADSVMRAIKSIINQNTDLKIEIILVDDGSCDYTSKKVSVLFPETVIVKTENAGPGKARNLGVQAASSDVVMFLDSDDIWFPDHASSLYKTIKNCYEFAYGITLNHNEVSGGQFLIPDMGKGRNGDCFRAMSRWCFTVPSSVALTRKAFEAVNGFPERIMGEDWAFFIKLGARFSFGFSEKIITERTLHKGSLCSVSGLAGRITSLLGYIRQTVEEEGLQDKDIYGFFEKALEITEKEGKSWQTFQDFFTATRNLEPLP